jgi:hypothetical protein
MRMLAQRRRSPALAAFHAGSRALLPLLLALGAVVPTENHQRETIAFDRQVLRFELNRADLTVGLVRVSILTPDLDWRVAVPKDSLSNYQEAGPYKNLELRPVGTNAFELPPFAIEPPEAGAAGPVCLAVKAWFNEVPNEYESFYWSRLDDRYSLLSFCTRDDERARPRHSQNRVPTLQAFRAGLAKTFLLDLRLDMAPWRPAIFIDSQGTTYFHSLLIGRHTAGALSHHLVEAWKRSPSGAIERIPLPERWTRASWPDRATHIARDRHAGLLHASLADVVAADAAGNVYSSANNCRPDVKSAAARLVRVDRNGHCHAIDLKPAPGGSRAESLHRITAIAAGSGGHVYVADGAVNVGSWIRRVAPDGTVTTLAGSAAVGFADGTGGAARFYLPSALAVGAKGDVFAADPVNGRVRRISPDGVVSTIDPDPADAGGFRFIRPSGVALGRGGELYVLDGGSQMARVSVVDAAGRVRVLMTLDPTTRTAVQP